VIKLRRKKYAAYVAHMEKTKRGVPVMVGKYEIKILLGIPRRGLKNNIKIDLMNGTREQRMELPDSGQRQEGALANTVMNGKRAEHLRLAEEISASQERFCFRFCDLIF
jgi:hypothetical protein